MCWHGILENKKIATEDVKCYKIVLRFVDEPYLCFRPYFRYKNTPMEYEIGKTYHDKICLEITKYTGHVTIHKGIHCYDSSVCICSFYGDYGKQYEVSNLLLCTTFSKIGTFFSRSDCEAVLVECTIPKGTLYYVNDEGEIVTEKLIINKVV